MAKNGNVQLIGEGREEEAGVPAGQRRGDGRGPGLCALVHATLLGLVEGSASRQVVAAALAALVRTGAGETCGGEEDEELPQRARDLKNELPTRDAVGEVAGRVFSHAKPAKAFLAMVDQQLGGVEYDQQVQRCNLAAHLGERRAGPQRRSPNSHTRARSLAWTSTPPPQCGPLWPTAP